MGRLKTGVMVIYVLGFLSLVKGDIQTEELYQSALWGILAVSIFPVSAVVGSRTSQTLVDVVRALFA